MSMLKNRTQTEQAELREELWELYQYEQANDTGFFAPRRWNKGSRNFASFCAERLADIDSNKD